MKWASDQIKISPHSYQCIVKMKGYENSKLNQLSFVYTFSPPRHWILEQSFLLYDKLEALLCS